MQTHLVLEIGKGSGQPTESPSKSCLEASGHGFICKRQHRRVTAGGDHATKHKPGVLGRMRTTGEKVGRHGHGCLLGISQLRRDAAMGAAELPLVTADCRQTVEQMRANRTLTDQAIVASPSNGVDCRGAGLITLF